MFQLPTEFRWATIASPLLERRVASASAIARAHEALLAQRTIVVGDTGSGKTSLGCAIGREIMRGRDVNGMFLTSLALDKARREHSLGRGDAELVDRAVMVPVLMLDELGAEDGVSGTLKHVLQERHGAGRQTIISCVLSIDGLRRHYDGGILRRLFEGALVIACDAKEQPRLKSEVRTISLRRPWRPAPTEPEPSAVPMPPAIRAQLDAALASIGAGGAVAETSGEEHRG